jgi:hypothetical protein
MRVSQTAQRMGIIAGTIGVIAALAAVPAQASNTKPAGMSRPEYRALMLRSQALNQKYQLGVSGPVPGGMTAAEYRALMLRSQALNRTYHLGAFAPATRVVTADASFSWVAFGIGAAAMLGLALLAGGAVVGGRYARRVPRARISS